MQTLLNRWPLLFVVVLAAGMLLMVACGDDKDEDGKTTPGATVKVTTRATAGAGDTTGVTDTEIKIACGAPKLHPQPSGSISPEIGTVSCPVSRPLAAGAATQPRVVALLDQATALLRHLHEPVV